MLIIYFRSLVDRSAERQSIPNNVSTGIDTLGLIQN